MLDPKSAKAQGRRIFEAYWEQCQRFRISPTMARRLIGATGRPFENWRAGAAPTRYEHLARMKDVTARFRKLDPDRLPLNFVGPRGYFKLREYLEIGG